MSRWDHETFRARPRPCVLAIGCEPEAAAQIHSAAALVGAIVKEADQIGAAVKLATQTPPLVIALPRGLHALYPDDFDALAREVGATLVVLPDGALVQADLEKQLYDAVVDASRRSTPDKV